MPFRWNIFTNDFDITGDNGGGGNVNTDVTLEENKVVVGAGTNFVKVSGVTIDLNDNLFDVNTLSVIDILTTQQNLELEPGVDVQVWSSILDQFALLNPVPGDIIYADSDPKWTKRAIANEGDVLTIRSGFPVWETVKLRSTGQTIDTQQLNILIKTMDDVPGIFHFQSRVTGFTDTQDLGTGTVFDYSIRTTGTDDAVILGLNQSNINADPQLTDASIEIISIASDVFLEVIGVAGRTINWTVETTIMEGA